MSYERACINCERCYNLAQHHIKDNNSFQDEEVRESQALSYILRDSILYEARNQAMMAIEQTVARQGSADQVLHACRFCDFSKPSIVHAVEGENKPIRILRVRERKE